MIENHIVTKIRAVLREKKLPDVYVAEKMERFEGKNKVESLLIAARFLDGDGINRLAEKLDTDAESLTFVAQFIELRV